jgi:hypothetical protein
MQSLQIIFSHNVHQLYLLDMFIFLHILQLFSILIIYYQFTIDLL